MTSGTTRTGTSGTARGGLVILAEVAGIAAIVVGVILLASSPLLSAESGRHEQDETDRVDRAA